MTAISNGGAAQRVKVLTDADLRVNGGQYYLEGRPPVAVYGVTDAETVAQGGQFVVMGNVAQPVYVVDTPDGVIEATIAPIPMIAVEGGLALGGPAIPVYVVGGSLGGGLDPVGNLTLEVTGADFDVITASWNAVTGATEYDVEYSPDGVTYTPVDTTSLLTYDITGSDYDIDTAIHYVRVRASNGSVDSDWTVVQVAGVLINAFVSYSLNTTAWSDNIGSADLVEIGGDVNTIAGKLGNGADMSTSNYLRSMDSAWSNAANNPFSLAYWIKFRALGNGFFAIVILRNGGAEALPMLVDPSNNFYLPSFAISPYVVDAWYHIVIGSDGTTQYTYVNGSLAGSGALTIGVFDGFELASNTTTDHVPDEVLFCKGRFWSNAQIAHLYNSGTGRAYPFLP